MYVRSVGKFRLISMCLAVLLVIALIIMTIIGLSSGFSQKLLAGMMLCGYPAVVLLVINAGLALSSWVPKDKNRR